MRICAVLAQCPLLFLLGSYGRTHVPPAKAPDPAKAALIEELIVTLKAEQQQQQAMQTMQTAMQNQIDQMLDSPLETLGYSSQANAEKRQSAQSDVQDFQRPMFA